MTPDPLLRSIAGSPVPPSCCSSAGAYPVTKICTTDGLTFAASSSSDRENSPSASGADRDDGCAAAMDGNAHDANASTTLIFATSRGMAHIRDFCKRISHLHADSPGAPADHNAVERETQLGDVRVRLGTRVRQLRRSKRLTQAQLAARAGISAKTVGEVERGEANPTISLLEDICSALSVEVAFLFDAAESPSAYIMTVRDLQTVREAVDALDTVFGAELTTPARARRRR